MLIIITLLAIGILNQISNVKYKSLQAEQFPSVQPDQFAAWKALKLKGNHLNLWATALLISP